MSITRLHIYAAEQNGYLDDVAVFGDDPDLPTISATQIKTGSAAYRMDAGAGAFGRAFPAYYSAFRTGAWLRHIGINDLNGKVYLYVAAHDSNSEGMNLRVLIDAESGKLQILRQLDDNNDEALLEEDVAAVLMREAVWMHIGIVHIISATVGVLQVYCDGVLVHELEGDTRLSTYNELGAEISYSDQASNIFMLGRVSGGATAGWNQYAYVDDYYIDSYEEEEPSAPPAYRFFFQMASAAGTHDDWTPQGDTPNVDCIDDSPHDDDTTYNYTDAVGQRDSFQIAAFSKPADHIISAVIPCAFSRRVNVSNAPRLILHAYDGLNFGESPELQLPMDWTFPLIWRLSAAPDDSAWSQADVNGCEYGYTSETA